MLSLRELRSFARESASMLARQKDLADFEIYCSSGQELIARLNYTSDIPSRGVEEVKSSDADGFAIRVVFRRDARESATASEAGDLSLESLRRTLDRARRQAVVDPHFPGLPNGPKPPGDATVLPGDLMRAPDAAIVEAAWKIVRSALNAFARNAPSGLSMPGLIIGGDVTLLRDRIALAGSRFPDIRTDESAHFRSSVTALIEALDAKGTASVLGNSRDDLGRLASLGARAVNGALKLRHGQRPSSGIYRVMLGPQPVAEVLNYMVIPSLTAGAFHAASSAYQGRFGASVMDSRLNLIDDPQAGPGAVHRRISCEGLPARRVELVRDGRLIGLLSNFYDAHRLIADEDRRDKLGPQAEPGIEFATVNGYRLGDGGGRRFDANPGTAATNVFMRARGGVNERALHKALGDGIYVGRIWYTYPINGQRAGDFTCTITGDSWLVKRGQLVAPLAPNCLRINATLDQVFGALVAVGNRCCPAQVWGSPEAYYVPAIVVDALPLSAIGPAVGPGSG